MNKEMMMKYLENKIALKDIDPDECLEITYMLLDATFPLMNKAIRHEYNHHLNGIYQSCLDEIEAAMEGIS